MDCDIALVSAYHLLLGRLWQFDLDVTHSGHYNYYLFMYEGVRHVLKLMLESAIMAEIFATIKVKKKAAAIPPQPRVALIQEGENNVNIGAQIIASKHSCNDPKMASSILEDDQNMLSPGSETICKDPRSEPDNCKIPRKGEESVLVINSLDNSSERSHYNEAEITATVANTSSMQFGLVPEFVKHRDNKSYENIIIAQMERSAEDGFV